MPLDETLETYGHFVREADTLGLAYITLVRYAAKLDGVIDGKSHRLRRPSTPIFRSLLTLTRQTTRNAARRPRIIPSLDQAYFCPPQCRRVTL